MEECSSLISGGLEMHSEPVSGLNLGAGASLIDGFRDRSLSVQVQSKWDEMEDLRKREESRQTKIAKAKVDLSAADEELAKLPPFEPPKEEIVNVPHKVHAAYLEDNISDAVEKRVTPLIHDQMPN
ncbi:hypothetical protein EJ110_NYTH60044 [Nymphaea thermarum]|nr:hypothetical protein EJ110_NYTH60044 [Nymphaea thermarum]